MAAEGVIIPNNGITPAFVARFSGDILGNFAKALQNIGEVNLSVASADTFVRQASVCSRLAWKDWKILVEGWEEEDVFSRDDYVLMLSEVDADCIAWSRSTNMTQLRLLVYRKWQEDGSRFCALKMLEFKWDLRMDSAKALAIGAVAAGGGAAIFYSSFLGPAALPLALLYAGSLIVMSGAQSIEDLSIDRQRQKALDFINSKSRDIHNCLLALAIKGNHAKLEGPNIELLLN